MIAATPWKKYVDSLCTHAWDFSAAETDRVVADIEQLIDAGAVTDQTVVELLMRAGVSETSALLIAPSVRVSIIA